MLLFFLCTLYVVLVVLHHVDVMNGFRGKFGQVVLKFFSVLLYFRGFYFFILQQVLVNVHLLSHVHHLLSDVLVIVKDVFILSVKLETFIFEVVPFFDDGFELLRDGIVNELVLNIFLELMEKFSELKDLNFIGFNELVFMLENGLFESLIHS
jgi:hypothetical protein